MAESLQVAGWRSFAPELALWVQGRYERPLQQLLQQHGITVLQEPAQLAQRLGLRVSEIQGIHITTVLRGGAAEQAGFAAGDEWLGLEAKGKMSVRAAGADEGGWRMSRLDDLTLYAGTATQVIALVARDKRLLRLELPLPPPIATWRLAVHDAALANEWLQGKA